MVELWTHGGTKSDNPFLKIGEYLKADEIVSITGGFAYATLSGVSRLIDALDSQGMKSIPKDVVVGIHQGITEPRAIRVLSDLPNTQVRVFANSKKPTMKTLFENPIYHPKFVSAIDKKGRAVWIVGSANLTNAALGANGSNFELAVISSISKRENDRISLDIASWRKLQEGNLRKPNDTFLDAYSEARISALKANPSLVPLAEWSGDIAQAKWLFLEVGAGSGMDRHQVEFTEGLAQFFGKPKTSRIDLRLGEGNALWSGRPLTPKVTTFGVTIYRLGMPTVKSGGEPIAHRVIRFERTDEVDRFRFNVTDSNSASHSDWMSDASLYGHLGLTSGGRQFGYAAV